jgi:glycosyltransferase involved in cell wall biosynthesis
VHILFLSRWFPYPADNGSKIRILGLLQELSKRYTVTLLSFVGPDEEDYPTGIRALREYCARVKVLPYRDFQPSSPQALAGLLARRPRYLVDTFHAEMQQAVATELRDRWYDVIIASQLDMAPYALTRPDVPALLEELEMAPFWDDRDSPSLPRRWRASLTWLKLSAYVRSILPRFASCTVASETELRLLRDVAPRYSNAHVIPNAIDLSRYTQWFGPPEANTLVYSGALTYDANYDAVLHFARDVQPIIRESIPDARLRVTGRHNGVQLGDIAQTSGVEFTGYLEDVRPIVARSWAAVVPLRRGGGTRLKILEAMALGTPVVSTPKGAEGLVATDGEQILLAANPRAFASKVVELLRSPELRAHLAASGQALVRAKYDTREVGERICGLVEGLAVGRTR